jgi:hypothetical protein
MPSFRASFSGWVEDVNILRTELVTIDTSPEDDDDLPEEGDTEEDEDDDEEEVQTITVPLKGAIVMPYQDNTSSIVPEGERFRKEYLMISGPEEPIVDTDAVLRPDGLKYQITMTRNLTTHWESILRKR